MKKLVIIIAVLLVIAANVQAPIATSSPLKHAEEQTLLNEFAARQPCTSYTDPIYGFSICYPEKWLVMPADEEQGSQTLLVPESSASSGPYEAIIEFGVFMVDRDPAVPLENWVLPSASLTGSFVGQYYVEINQLPVLVQEFDDSRWPTVRVYIPRESKVFFADFGPVGSPLEQDFWDVLNTLSFPEPYNRVQPVRSRAYVDRAQFQQKQFALHLDPPSELSLPFAGDYTISQGPNGSYSHHCSAPYTYTVDCQAIDFIMPIGTRVYAPASGIWVFEQRPDPYGNTAYIFHANGTETWLAHLSSTWGYQDGLAVLQGHWVGRSGIGGTGQHLHMMTLECDPNHDPVTNCQSLPIDSLTGIRWNDPNNKGDGKGIAHGPPALFRDPDDNISRNDVSFLFAGDEANLETIPLRQDTAHFIRIGKDWIALLYRDVNYQGTVRQFDHSGGLGDLSGQASSIKVAYAACPIPTGARSTEQLQPSNGPPVCVPTPPPPSTDNATFVADITIPDGTVVTPGQALHKVWRVRNSGTSTWGSGYQLAFVGGDQMGAPSAVDVPATAPGAEVDIAVDMTAPTTLQSYKGYWKIRNAQGTYFGDQLWVSISVSDGSPPSDVIELTCLDCPGVATPGQQFRPTIMATVRTGQLLESRGDMLRNTDGNLFGAWPHIAVVGTVNAGESYGFTFYADHPLTAPTEEGTYETKWRVWRDGDWAGQEITIHFDVRVGGGTRPDPPSLVSPNDWWVSRDGSTPQLCASAPGGLQYYFQIYESHDTPESGWISSSCWTPPALGPYTYQWHVKVRDPGSGLESDWSTTWHFSIDSQELTIDPLEFVPGSPSAAEEVRVYTCVRGFGGIGLALKIEANTATDGSADGEWQWIHHLGTFCYNHDDPNTWPNWGTLPQADGTHLIRATGYHNGETVVAEATYTLQHRRPTAPRLLSPVDGIKINTRMVTFRWEPGMEAPGDDPRTLEYQLLVSENADPGVDPLLNVTLDGDTISYVHTFGADYPSLHWRVIARNALGESGNTTEFGIDRVSPNSSITALPPAVTEIQFVVQWGGSDNLSGVRWYDVQYRDGPRGDWVDWLMSTTTTAAIFSGQTGHTYYFRSRALDNAGNLEDWPDGDGDTHTTVDLSAVPPTPWWDSGYGFKRNLLVLNNDSQALPVGYPIRLHFDSGTVPTSMELYAASQSAVKGDDVRVIYGNTTELSRFVQRFQSDAIDLWFNLQVGIAPNPGQDNTSYQLYYGNPAAANPPGAINDVCSPFNDASTVGLWHFEEGSGSVVGDDSGRGHNGTANGSFAWSLEGKCGTDMWFDGSSAYVDFGNPPDFGVGAFTLEAWVYHLPGGPSEGGIVSKALDGGGAPAYGLFWAYQKVGLRINGSGYLLGNTQLLENRWYHLAATYDGTTARVFLNGVLDGSQNLGGPASSSLPLVVGRSEFAGKSFYGYIQGVRVANQATSSFPHGGFGLITSEPSSAAGAETTPPTPGSADLALMGMAAYPNPAGGVLVQAVVLNQGDKATQNGFYTDLYVDHLPTGPGDYTGSISFWVDDSIEPGATVTLTIVLTDVVGLTGLTQAEPLGESTVTLYSQADSEGVVGEPDDGNNISAGLEVCVASPDQYEDDDTSAAARWIALGSTQSHNFDGMGDQDWLKFSAQAGEAYTLSTSDLGTAGDTYLYLYDTDHTTLLAANDDYGGSLASRIEWTAPANGIYYLLVKHWNPNVGGCGTAYDVVVVDVEASHWMLYLPLVEKNYRNGFSDDFCGSALDPGWTWVDPLGDCSYSLLANPCRLRLYAPDRSHDLYMNLDAPRMLQSVEGDFVVTTKVTVYPQYNYQGAGLLVWQDKDNYIRLERTLVDGIDSWYRIGGEYGGIQIHFSNPIAYLKCQRHGNHFTTWYSENAIDWIEVAALDYPAESTLQVGVVLINEWQDNPISADFEFFTFGGSAASSVGLEVFPRR